MDPAGAPHTIGVTFARPNPMRIVVTGATGNLGTSVIERLAREREVREIIGVARRTPGRVPPGVRHVSADIVEADLVRIFKGADAVVHLAWQIQPARKPGRLYRVNVEGSRRVLDAVIIAGVPQLVVASSVGAYSPGPKDKRVDESWPVEGIVSSMYSRQKVRVEQMLDEIEASRPMLKVVRMRPALVFKASAASEIRRLFLGRLVPRRLVRPGFIPFVPKNERLRFQVVHSKDVGDAFARAVLRRVRGPFNLAAEPVLDGEVIAATLNATPVPVPWQVLRAAAAASYQLHLQPSNPGWLDLALNVPLMDTRRAEEILGWLPSSGAAATLLELMEGIRERGAAETAPLHA